METCSTFKIQSFQSHAAFKIKDFVTTDVWFVSGDQTELMTDSSLFGQNFVFSQSRGTVFGIAMLVCWLVG